MIKAQCWAADAQVRMGETAIGIGELTADTKLAIQRAKDKTDGVGLSRLYVGVYFPSDMLGGCLLGSTSSSMQAAVALPTTTSDSD